MPNTASNPAKAGDYISVYGTGFGPYAAPSADGLTRLQFPVTATIGGIPAVVSYAGAAPLETTGLQQINILVPSGAGAGPAVPLALTVNGVSTASGVTIVLN